ncbi:hypothetical protein BV898_06857 [Hypsibius exemplaris]|uniref:G-protein coupled receptors family 1 profile domain-containing protein n=1 Tax=Hypsibius exemplaris TaxID=2072580 RepID=A0A1W0WUZ4_HYPEX|nr:hypothetical protein BV898_06857 [Hypsibius exemplaris]
MSRIIVLNETDENQSINATVYYAILLYSLGAATIIANSVFILTILANLKLRTCSNYLLVSNSYADLLVGVFLLPCVGVDWVDPANYTRNACLVWFVTNNYVYAVSIAHMTAISIERFIRVFHTVWHTRWMRKLTVPVLGLCWTGPSLTTYLRLFLPMSQAERSFDVKNGTCSAVLEDVPHGCIYCNSRDSTILGVALEFSLPMVISIAAYIAIVMAAVRRIHIADQLRKSVLNDAEHNRTPLQEYSWRIVFGPVERVATSPEYRSIRLYSTVLFLFVCSWLPQSANRLFLALTGDGFPDFLSGLSRDLVKEYEVPPGFYIWSNYNFRCVTNLIGSANSLVNPLLFFYMSPRFRSGLGSVKDRLVFFPRDRSGSCTSAMSVEPAFDARHWNELANHFSQFGYETDA